MLIIVTSCVSYNAVGTDTPDRGLYYSKLCVNWELSSTSGHSLQREQDIIWARQLTPALLTALYVTVVSLNVT